MLDIAGRLKIDGMTAPPSSSLFLHTVSESSSLGRVACLPDSLRMQITSSLPDGISLVSADNLEEWYLDIKVLDNNPLYLDKTFRLLFRFGDQYPIGIQPPKYPRICFGPA